MTGRLWSLAVLGVVCSVFSVATADPGPPGCNPPSLEATTGLISRLLPHHTDQFCLFDISPHPTIDDDDAANSFHGDENGAWQVECEDGPDPPGRRRRVVIRASDPVAAASGLHWYLKYHVNASVSWNGNQLDTVPDDLECPSTPLTGTTSYEYRYYLNTCTFGYSAAFWSWARWQQEIDWMALNGIQTPLAFVGQEYFWQEAFTQDLRLTKEDMAEFFAGPAFLPWNRMGNLAAWEGPLPSDWLQARLQLQHQILTRMRQFGMRPVLPGFNGFVPAAFVRKYPNATVYRSSGWSGFPATYQLSPLDPMFSVVAQSILNRMVGVWSTDHLYSVDLWNELSPSSGDLNKLGDVARAVYTSLSTVDSNAVWVMQGWMFLNDASFWQPARIKSFVKAVPTGSLLILDLFSDVHPVWSTTESYYDTPFVWNMLHNFGGRSGMYGRLPVIAADPGKALAANASTGALRGLGLTPEAIGFNPIVYDLMMENVWRGEAGVQDLDAWVGRWAERRYGVAPTQADPSPPALGAIHAAWALLQTSVYSCGTDQQGTSASIFTARPAFGLTSASCCDTLELYYDPSDVVSAWELLLSAADDAPFLTARQTFAADIVAVTAQAASDAALELYESACVAFDNRDADTFDKVAQRFLSMLTDLDAVLGTQADLLLGTWIQDALSWAPTPTPTPTAPMVVGVPHAEPTRFLRRASVSTTAAAAAAAATNRCAGGGVAWLPCDARNSTECVRRGCCVTDGGGCVGPQGGDGRTTTTTNADASLYTRNARTQITLWGSKTSPLHDYAAKLWSGMAAGFYSARWSAWFNDGLKALSDHRPFDNQTFLTSIEAYEFEWTQSADVPPAAPTGDAVSLSAAFYAKYFKL